VSGLPANGQPWPLSGNAERYARMPRQDAWYSGDPARLAAVYGGAAAGGSSNGPPTTLNPSGTVKAVIGAVRSAFWASRSTGEEADTRLHLPTPEDIARHSARLLFSERLNVRVIGPVHEADGPKDAAGEFTFRKGGPKPETVAAQARLDKILGLCKFDALLLAAAEISSALGSTGLRIAFNKDGPISDRPMIARVDADATLPVYSWGQLVGVMFWQVVLHDANGVIWRHIEMHEGGKVYHGLYKGDNGTLGDRQELTANAATERLKVDAEGAITLLRDGGLTATSIPNMLPDPMDRRNNAGRSDFTPTVMGLFDTIDRVFTQMMDSIEDAKSRLLVSESMLEKGKPGQGKTFDQNQRIFTSLKVPPPEKEGGGLPIEKVQFEMHVQEYLQAIDWLVRQAIQAAGYSPGTDVGTAGRDVTATEILDDKADDMATRDVKIRYWQPELQALLTSFVAVDVAEFAPRDETGKLIQAYPVEVTFADAIQPAKLELATVAKALKEAGAASIFSLVSTVNPEWDATTIGIEVDRILEEAGFVDPATFGMAGAGVGPGDGV